MASRLPIKIVVQRGVCTGLVWYQNSKPKLFTDELHYCRVVWLANQIFASRRKNFGYSEYRFSFPKLSANELYHCRALEYSGPNTQNRIAEVESVEIYLCFWHSVSNIQGRGTEVLI